LCGDGVPYLIIFIMLLMLGLLATCFMV